MARPPGDVTPPTPAQQERFFTVCQQVLADRKGGGGPTGGIGTLGERTLHAVLKCYLEPDETLHEVKIGRRVADIARENEIVEIQTRSFGRLREKLDRFLRERPVTVVYPIARIKWIYWLNEEDGSLTEKRRSPKTGAPWDAFYELYQLRPMLGSAGLRFQLLFLDIEEYRLLNGWSADRKRGCTRFERIPLSLRGELLLDSPGSWLSMVPPGLPEPYTSRDFAKVAVLSRPTAQKALSVLLQTGAVERVGKEKNSYLYRTRT